jgi:hypothetical protein
MPKQPPRTWPIFIGSGFRVWAFFLSIFFYFFISKHGLLLAYLKISVFLWAVVAFWITYKTSTHAEHYFRENNFNFYFQSWLYAIGKVVFPLAFFLLLFASFIEIRPDKILLAKITGIPTEAFFPCSIHPLSLEHEKAARAVFKLSDIDTFNCNSGGQIAPAEGW